jgi:hypothetical protein
MHTNPSIKLPPKNYRLIIEELLHLIPDPALKLKFLKEVINENYKIPILYKYYPPLAETIYRNIILEKIEEIWPGSRKRAKTLVRNGTISSPRPALWLIYRCRYIVAFVILNACIWGFGTSLASLIGTLNMSTMTNYFKERFVGKKGNGEPLLESQLQGATFRAGNSEIFPKYLKEPIWLVEKKPTGEIYSNGLHVITTHTVENIPRIYYPCPKNLHSSPSQYPATSRIAGILYHASESDIFPFKPEMNKSIKRYTNALIRYLKQKKCYHYFIDRFGRVYRLVKEDHAAYHAGKSIWVDEEWIYLNLNHAFIGICFESKDFEETDDVKPTTNRKPKSISPHIKPTNTAVFTAAQLNTGKELTDWLRVKYNISQDNCVPHALASVNREKMLIGHHLDLSRGFPFSKFGLSNKYLEPLPSMVEFGFSYDDYFEKIFDGNLWPGIRTAEKLLEQRAEESNIDLVTYQKNLQKRFIRYSEWLSARK